MDGGALFGYDYEDVVKDGEKITTPEKTVDSVDGLAMDLVALTYIVHQLATKNSKDGSKNTILTAGTKPINTEYNKDVRITLSDKSSIIERPKFYVDKNDVSVSAYGDAKDAPKNGTVLAKVTNMLTLSEKKRVIVNKEAVINHIRSTLLSDPPVFATILPETGKSQADAQTIQDGGSKPEYTDIVAAIDEKTSTKNPVDETDKSVAAVFYLFHAWYSRVAQNIKDFDKAMQSIFETFSDAGFACAMKDESSVLVAELDDGGKLADSGYASVPIDDVRTAAVEWLSRVGV